MKVPAGLLNRIAKLEEEKRLLSGVKQAFSESEILMEEPAPKPGRGGTIPPAEHRFKPGQSGNPSGRTQAPILRLLNRLLAAQDHKQAQELAQSLVKLACKGNPTAVRELLARVDPIPAKTPTPTTKKESGPPEGGGT